MDDFRSMEEAALAALEPLRSEVRLRTLDVYSGQIDVETVDELTIQFPCIYVIVSGMDSERTNLAAKNEMITDLFVGDKNLRGDREARLGDSTSPGVYSLMEAARTKLHGVHLVNGWTPLMLTRAEPVAYVPKHHLCLYRQRYRCKSLK